MCVPNQGISAWHLTVNPYVSLASDSIDKVQVYIPIKHDADPITPVRLTLGSGVVYIYSCLFWIRFDIPALTNDSLANESTLTTDSVRVTE